jgi:hypothetical protein
VPDEWQRLRSLVALQQPHLTAPGPAQPGLCQVCRGPSGRLARCYQCDLHAQCADGGLADLVVPVAFAVKGGAHARRLWQYKSSRVGPQVAAGAASMLLALLLVFLRDHGPCAWRAAGLGRPTHVAVVPTARRRPGVHPLRELVGPCLLGPWAELTARPGGQRVRDLDPARFRAEPVPGARVLLVDDTWTTGASAQSAAMALRSAGARSVLTVVLGRHVGSALTDAVAFSPASSPFLPWSCPVHDVGARP